MTSLFGAPASSVDFATLTSWTSSDNVQHLAFIESNGSVGELHNTPGQALWTYQNLTGLAAAAGPVPVAPIATLTSWTTSFNNVQRVAFIDSNGHISELRNTPGEQSWFYENLSQLAGAPAARPGALTSWTTSSDNSQHVAFTGLVDNHVYELYAGEDF